MWLNSGWGGGGGGKAFFANILIGIRNQHLFYDVNNIKCTLHEHAVAGLKNCMRRGYSYIEGVEELLHALKQNNYEIHAFSNYPIW
jgi:hypothetical protein